METMVKQTVGENIRRLRKQAGFSQETFAKVCGLDRTYIASVELGRRNISVMNLEKIADALSIPASELLRAKDSNILLTVNGVRFLLNSGRSLTAEEKETLEIICRCAYDEDSSLADVLEDEDGEELYEKSPYELAELFQKAARADGIPVSFCPLDVEVKI